MNTMQSHYIVYRVNLGLKQVLISHIGDLVSELLK